MKTKIIIALVTGILSGVFAYHTWEVSSARHWRALKAYIAYIHDAPNVTPGPRSWLSFMNQSMDEPEPHLAALVQAGQLEHLDIVLPMNRASSLHWIAFCERHPQDIIYAYARENPSWVKFPAKGSQLLHINFWFPEASLPLVQQLISELKDIGTRDEPTGSP